MERKPKRERDKGTERRKGISDRYTEKQKKKKQKRKKKKDYGKLRPTAQNGEKKEK